MHSRNVPPVLQITFLLTKNAANLLPIAINIQANVYAHSVIIPIYKYRINLNVVIHPYID